MYHVQKNEQKNLWRPSASLNTLRQRAELLKIVRDFFYARHVLEVETPLLCHASVTDPFIQSIPAFPKELSDYFYLQTSPEYAMKRLLASGSGAIYQLSKAFRRNEVGRFHNPEFTMLEWYRLDFDHHQLMDEVDAFLQKILNTEAAERKTYAEIFELFFNINPHNTTLSQLISCAKEKNIVIHNEITDCDTWLNLLMTHYIEPQLGKNKPHFIYDFPLSQAALARIQSGNNPVASRFEVYVRGIELANGFHELQDAKEQRDRFQKNITERQSKGFSEMPIDNYFLEALEYGLPNCAGVALGVDRLVMLATKSEAISEVLSFDFSRV